LDWAAVRHDSNAAVLKFIAHGADTEGCGVSMTAAIRKTLVDAQIISLDKKKRMPKKLEIWMDTIRVTLNPQKARTTTPT